MPITQNRYMDVPDKCPNCGDDEGFWSAPLWINPKWKTVTARCAKCHTPLKVKIIKE